jgi:hypothetical protein
LWVSKARHDKARKDKLTIRRVGACVDSSDSEKVTSAVKAAAMAALATTNTPQPAPQPAAGAPAPEVAWA